MKQVPHIALKPHEVRFLAACVCSRDGDAGAREYMLGAVVPYRLVDFALIVQDEGPTAISKFWSVTETGQQWYDLTFQRKKT